MISYEVMGREPVMIRLDDDIRDAMRALKDRDGIAVNEQANRAMRMWLEQKGVLKKAKK